MDIVKGTLWQRWPSAEVPSPSPTPAASLTWAFAGSHGRLLHGYVDATITVRDRDGQQVVTGDDAYATIALSAADPAYSLRGGPTQRRAFRGQATFALTLHPAAGQTVLRATLGGTGVSGSSACMQIVTPVVQWLAQIPDTSALRPQVHPLVAGLALRAPSCLRPCTLEVSRWPQSVPAGGRWPHAVVAYLIDISGQPTWGRQTDQVVTLWLQGLPWSVSAAEGRISHLRCLAQAPLVAGCAVFTELVATSQAQAGVLRATLSPYTGDLLSRGVQAHQPLLCQPAATMTSFVPEAMLIEQAAARDDTLCVATGQGLVLGEPGQIRRSAG